MQINFNERIRKSLEEFHQTYSKYGFLIEESIIRSADIIYNMKNKKDTENKIIRTYIFQIAYLDTYKIYSYYQKAGLNNITDADFFRELCKIKDYDSLSKKIDNDSLFLESLLMACHEYSAKENLEKLIILKSLSQNENTTLQKIFSIHELDLENCNKQISTYDLMCFYEKKLILSIENDTDFCKDIQIMELCGLIRTLLKIDYKNGLNLIIEIGKIDYLMSKYLQEKGLEKEQINFFIRASFYENSPVDNIISRLINDELFLTTALSLVIKVNMERKYGIPLSQKVLKDTENDKVILKLNKCKKEKE